MKVSELIKKDLQNKIGKYGVVVTSVKIDNWHSFVVGLRVLEGSRRVHDEVGSWSVKGNMSSGNSIRCTEIAVFKDKKRTFMLSRDLLKILESIINICDYYYERGFKED